MEKKDILFSCSESEEQQIKRKLHGIFSTTSFTPQVSFKQRLEMCMFALTVSIVEPKNIKEAMADSAWIEAMQDELHQFDRLKVWELVDKPFGKMVI
ncbi:hypothetical protein Tco_0325357, partial [Tanacetum coccineum]